MEPYFGSFFLLLMSCYRFKQTVIVGVRVTVGTLRLTMKHALLVLSVFAAMFGALIVCAEKLGGASYRDVCDKMEADGVTSRTQTSQASQIAAEELTGNTLIVVGADQRGAGRRSKTVSNSEIIVSADLNKIATSTTTEASHPDGATLAQTGRSSACD